MASDEFASQWSVASGRWPVGVASDWWLARKSLEVQELRRAWVRFAIFVRGVVRIGFLLGASGLGGILWRALRRSDSEGLASRTPWLGS